MSNLSKTGVTNTVPGSHVDVPFDCNAYWTLAQYFACLRLSTRIGSLAIAPFGHRLGFVSNYAQRAKTIAATYARFYLEIEEGGSPKKKGRYYWMALGAFASKTVACSLDTWQVSNNPITPLEPDLIGKVRDGLGKGNMWLFQDIAPWHWFYNHSPDSFTQCLPARDVPDKLYTAMQSNIKKLPWWDDALPKIKHMHVSQFIQTGFRLVAKIESEVDPVDRADDQLAHLLEIAKHEQGVILQPLIYDDPIFAKWVAGQRYMKTLPVLGSMTPGLELVFTHACETKNPELESVAPADTILENYKSRMIWIGLAAKKFHGLMQNKTAFMEAEITTMAGWWSP